VLFLTAPQIRDGFILSHDDGMAARNCGVIRASWQQSTQTM
jgi:hypothetical protein